MREKNIYVYIYIHCKSIILQSNFKKREEKQPSRERRPFIPHSLQRWRAYPRKTVCSAPPGICEQFQLVRILCPGQNSMAGWLHFMISPCALSGQAGVFRTERPQFYTLVRLSWTRERRNFPPGLMGTGLNFWGQWCKNEQRCVLWGP